MAPVTQHLEVVLVVEAADGAVGADERQDVVDLEAQLVAGVGAAGDGVFADLRGLEAAALASPAGATAGGAAGEDPDVVALELAGVAV
jgi:hypothetical protein